MPTWHTMASHLFLILGFVWSPMSLLFRPEMFKMLTASVFDMPRLLILFSMLSQIMLICRHVSALLLLSFTVLFCFRLRSVTSLA